MQLLYFAIKCTWVQNIHASGEHLNCKSRKVVIKTLFSQIHELFVLVHVVFHLPWRINFLSEIENEFYIKDNI